VLLVIRIIIESLKAAGRAADVRFLIFNGDAI